MADQRETTQRETYLGKKDGRGEVSPSRFNLKPIENHGELQDKPPCFIVDTHTSAVVAIKQAVDRDFKYRFSRPMCVGEVKKSFEI